jgi:hypothetical protein
MLTLFTMELGIVVLVALARVAQTAVCRRSLLGD